MPEAGGFLGFAHGLVDGEVEDAGHGADFVAHAFTGAEKEGVDQVAGIEGGLTHQGAKRLAAAETAHPRFRKAHGSDCRRKQLGDDCNRVEGLALPGPTKSGTWGTPNLC